MNHKFVVLMIVMIGAGGASAQPPGATSEGSGQTAERAARSEPIPPTVRVVVDYGDGVERHYTRIRWTAGMTVMDALQRVAAHPRGIGYEARGQGATAFVNSLDELANEGNGRNWIFRVNDQLAQRGAGVTRLERGDRLSWHFATYGQDD